jgi:hypothetical protein
MTVQEFISRSQDYYNSPYTPEQKRVVTAWLQRHSERVITLLYAEVVKILSTSYKTPPAVHELEKALTVVRDHRWPEIESRPALPESTDPICTPEEAREYIRQLNEVVSALSRSKNTRYEGVNDGLSETDK